MEGNEFNFDGATIPWSNFNCGITDPSGTQLCYNQPEWNGHCVDACSQEGCAGGMGQNWGACDRANVECKTYSHLSEPTVNHYAHLCNNLKKNGTGCAGSTKACSLGVCKTPEEYDEACSLVTESAASSVYLTDPAYTNKCCGNNAILNPGFEMSSGGSTIPTYWDFGNAQVRRIAGTFKGVSPHSGTAMLRIEAAPGTIARAKVPVTILPNRDYTFSGWVYRVDSGDVLIEVRENDYAMGCDARLTGGSKSWEHISCSFRSKSTSTSATIRQIQISVRGTSPAAVVYFDDMQLIGNGLDLGATTNSGSNQTCTFNGKNWAWKDAVLQPFKIIKGTDMFDDISNGNRWYSCVDGVNSFPATATFIGTNLVQHERIAPPGSTLQIFNQLPSNQGIGGGFKTETLITGAISQDEFERSIVQTEVSSEQKSTITASVEKQKVQFTLIPNVVDYPGENQLSLYTSFLIGKIPTNPNYQLISNKTDFKILVKNGNKYLETVHNTKYEMNKKISEINITLNVSDQMKLDTGKHSLNITIINLCLNEDCSDFKNKSFIFENAFDIKNDITVYIEPVYTNPEKFLCINQGGLGDTTTIGKIIECCGSNFNYCKNTDSTRIAGGPTGLILDYYSSAGKNGVLRGGFPEIMPEPDTTGDLGYYEEYYTISDIPIRNWKQYDYLEFDIYLSGSKNLNMLISEETNPDLAAERDTKIIFQDNVLKYSTTGSDLNKWHHVKIPITAELKSHQPKRIKFYVKQRDLQAELGAKNALGKCTVSSCKRINITGLGEFLMVLGLDRFYLSSSSTQYCILDLFNDPARGSTNIGKWVNDLDYYQTNLVNSILACNNVASFLWTGNKCCGDDQGKSINETFNDDNAGCWAGLPAKNNTVSTAILSQEDDCSLTDSCPKTNLLMYKLGGELKFRSCRLSNDDWTKLNSQFENKNANNIDNIQELCKNLGSWYCDYTSSWENAFKYNKSQPVNAKRDIPLDNDAATFFIPPLTIDSPSSCCPSTYCWTGLKYDEEKPKETGCVSSFTEPKRPPIFLETQYGATGYRCNATGSWRLVSLKSDYYRKDTGYCNENSECYANNKCFSSGEWILDSNTDRMCYNGNWTTRTKYIAATLLDYAETKYPDDYTLYCDKLENALGVETLGGTPDYKRLHYKLVNLTAGLSNPYPDKDVTSNEYLGIPSVLTEDRLTAQYNSLCKDKQGDTIPCVNNFCVLRSGDFVIIGTSLNEQLNETKFPFYQLVGMQTENLKSTVTGLNKLSNNIIPLYSSLTTGTMYYVPRKQVIFYSLDNAPGLSGTLTEDLKYIMMHPIRTIISLITKITSGTSEEFTDKLDKSADFDKVYFAKKTMIGNDKTIIGVQETKFNISGLAKSTENPETFITINYTGFTPDIICQAADNKGLGCNQSTTDAQYIYAVRPASEGFDDVWPDLTAKVRIQ